MKATDLAEEVAHLPSDQAHPDRLVIHGYLIGEMTDAMIGGMIEGKRDEMTGIMRDGTTEERMLTHMFHQPVEELTDPEAALPETFAEGPALLPVEVEMTGLPVEHVLPADSHRAETIVLAVPSEDAPDHRTTVGPPVHR